MMTTAIYLPVIGVSYKPVMPTFQGQVSEEQILQLIAYIKSLSKEPAQ